MFSLSSYAAGLVSGAMIVAILGVLLFIIISERKKRTVKTKDVQDVKPLTLSNEAMYRLSDMADDFRDDVKDQAFKHVQEEGRRRLELTDVEGAIPDVLSAWQARAVKRKYTE